MVFWAFQSHQATSRWMPLITWLRHGHLQTSRLGPVDWKHIFYKQAQVTNLGKNKIWYSSPNPLANPLSVQSAVCSVWQQKSVCAGCLLADCRFIVMEAHDHRRGSAPHRIARLWVGCEFGGDVPQGAVSVCPPPSHQQLLHMTHHVTYTSSGYLMRLFQGGGWMVLECL